MLCPKKLNKVTLGLKELSRVTPGFKELNRVTLGHEEFNKAALDLEELKRRLIRKTLQAAILESAILSNPSQQWLQRLKQETAHQIAELNKIEMKTSITLWMMIVSLIGGPITTNPLLCLHQNAILASHMENSKLTKNNPTFIEHHISLYLTFLLIIILVRVQYYSK